MSGQKNTRKASEEPQCIESVHNMPPVL